MPISVNLEIPLKLGAQVHKQDLDYENIPSKCSRCHEYGHLESKCSCQARWRRVSKPKLKIQEKPWEPRELMFDHWPISLNLSKGNMAKNIPFRFKLCSFHTRNLKVASRGGRIETMKWRAPNCLLCQKAASLEKHIERMAQVSNWE